MPEKYKSLSHAPPPRPSTELKRSASTPLEAWLQQGSCKRPGQCLHLSTYTLSQLPASYPSVRLPCADMHGPAGVDSVDPRRKA